MPRPSITCVIISLALGVTTTSQVIAAPDFYEDVQPILVQHCILCHGPGSQESNYRIDRTIVLMAGSDSELTAVVPGRPLQSHLWQRVNSEDQAVRMPPKGPGLNEAEKRTIREWIEGGAHVPKHRVTNMKTDHWSFQEIRATRPPATSNDFLVSNEVDSFILAKLESEGLSLSKPADRHTLVRRVYLVLLGLQPTPEQISKFVEDEDVNAYSRLIEDVLANPHYGERWAQHWLDCVRYAESTGYEINKAIPNIYPYRDYVIKSLNADIPYDQFLREQIAGDYYRQDAATGFLMVGPHDTNPSPDPRLTAMQFQDGHDEIIKTVSAVTMGLTLGCARCHDHKFDPLTQEDYYRFQAVFAGVSYGSRAEQGVQYDQMKKTAEELLPEINQLNANALRLRTENNLLPPIDLVEYEEVVRPLKTDRIRFVINHTNDGNAPELDDVEVWTVASPARPSVNIAHRDNGATATSSPTAKGNQGKGADLLLDGSRQLLLYYKAADKSDVWFEIRFSRSVTIDKIIIKPRGKGVPVDYQVKTPLENGDWRTIVDSRRRYPHLSDIRDVNTLELAGITDDQRKLIIENTATLRALTSRYDKLLRGPQLYVGKFHSPRTTYLMKGGDPQNQGPVVSPGFLEVLSDMEPAGPNEDLERRLALANAIGSKSNPLTARVITNRIWQHYFGTGIVDTPSDFGLNGGSPSHPELLDWLATYLMDHDWSLKQLHRVILNSATFRQVSHSRSEAFGRDSESRLLWRFPPQRLEAEVLRDSILHASGKLNTVAYGEPFKFFEEATSQFANRVTLQTFTPEGWRRMIYGEKLRLVQVGVFGVFDCPDASQMTPRRTTSTSAAQALSLFNSSFVNNQAAFMASEIENSFPNDPRKQLESAFLRVLSRPPTKQESDILLPLVYGNGLEPLGRILFNLNEFIFLN